MSGSKSRNKGKAGELEALNYLRKLGFTDARRRQQSSGWAAAEVECIESLPNIHFEIKCGYAKGMGVGTAIFRAACAQAFGDCNGKEWALLWREKGCKIWKLTYRLAHGIGVVTVAGDDTIRDTLRFQNG